jgi:hypothetical protein
VSLRRTNHWLLHQADRRRSAVGRCRADNVHVITCNVTATNAAGSHTRASNGVAVGISAPANTVAPAVSGIPVAGATLTCSTGTWTGSPTAYSYNWRKGGTTLGALDQATYKVALADETGSIDCVVTATNAGGSTGQASNALTIVAGMVSNIDPSDTSTITSSSGSVSQVTDKSGAAGNVTQGTTLNMPITGTRTINGLNVLDFDGTNSKMTYASSVRHLAYRRLYRHCHCRVR